VWLWLFTFLQQAEEKLAAAEAEVERQRVDLDKAEREFRVSREAHSRNLAEKGAECDAARAAAQRAEAEAAERHAQIGVLMDTIETLQVSPSLAPGPHLCLMP
jgi:membrane protein involved in colicin uptake